MWKMASMSRKGEILTMRRLWQEIKLCRSAVTGSGRAIMRH